VAKARSNSLCLPTPNTRTGLVGGLLNETHTPQRGNSEGGFSNPVVLKKAVKFLVRKN
jgi:hypothetical protein